MFVWVKNTQGINHDRIIQNFFLNSNISFPALTIQRLPNGIHFSFLWIFTLQTAVRHDQNKKKLQELENKNIARRSCVISGNLRQCLINKKIMSEILEEKWKLAAIWRSLDEFKIQVQIQTQQKKLDYVSLAKVLEDFVHQKRWNY